MEEAQSQERMAESSCDETNLKDIVLCSPKTRIKRRHDNDIVPHHEDSSAQMNVGNFVRIPGRDDPYRS